MGLPKVDIIIGMGPAGLAHALESVKNNINPRKVVLITDRPTHYAPIDSAMYTRNAIFRLDEDIMPYLESLIGVEKFADCLKSKLIGPLEKIGEFSFRTIQMKRLEMLLFEELERYNVEIIHVPKYSENHISDIDSDSQTLHISYKEKDVTLDYSIHFKYLIGAYGPNRGISELIPVPVEAYPTQHAQLHNRHARVTFKLPDGFSADQLREILAAGSLNPACQMEQFREQGWKLQSEPEHRKFAIEDVLFVAAEFPHAIKDPSLDEIDLWIKTILKQFCPSEIINQLHTIDTAVFNTDLHETNRTIYPFAPPGIHFKNDEAAHKHTSYFIPVADALRVTQYLTGSGVVVALREAQVYGQFLRSPQKLADLMHYHAKIAAIRDANRERVDIFLDKRAKREEDANTHLFFSKPAKFKDKDDQTILAQPSELPKCM